MRTSEQINEIAAALAKAQLGVKSALKDSFNPGFKSKYADLSAVKDAIGDCLSKNDIAVIQAHGILDTGQVVLSTRLMHKSGQWVESQYLIKPIKEDPQGYASATTYARRISLASMVGVVADEDDDGNAASQRGPVRDESAEDPAMQAAKAFVRKAIKETGAAMSEADLDNWVNAWSKHIEQLRAKYPEEAKAVDAAINAQRVALTKKAAAE